jgi:hypothetical protein
MDMSKTSIVSPRKKCVSRENCQINPQPINMQFCHINCMYRGIVIYRVSLVWTITANVWQIIYKPGNSLGILPNNDLSVREPSLLYRLALIQTRHHGYLLSSMISVRVHIIFTSFVSFAISWVQLSFDIYISRLGTDSQWQDYYVYTHTSDMINFNTGVTNVSYTI